MDLLTVLIVCLDHIKLIINPQSVWHVHQAHISQTMDPLIALIVCLDHIKHQMDLLPAVCVCLVFIKHKINLSHV